MITSPFGGQQLTVVVPQGVHAGQQMRVQIRLPNSSPPPALEAAPPPPSALEASSPPPPAYEASPPPPPPLPTLQEGASLTEPADDSEAESTDEVGGRAGKRRGGKHRGGWGGESSDEDEARRGQTLEPPSVVEALSPPPQELSPPPAQLSLPTITLSPPPPRSPLVRDGGLSSKENEPENQGGRRNGRRNGRNRRNATGPDEVEDAPGLDGEAMPTVLEAKTPSPEVPKSSEPELLQAPPESEPSLFNPLSSSDADDTPKPEANGALEGGDEDAPAKQRGRGRGREGRGRRGNDRFRKLSAI